MERPRVDYNKLAPTYHSRYDAGGLERVADALLALAGQISAKTILEVGCGTCLWVEILRSTGAAVSGADASTGMLNEARGRIGPQGLVAAKANNLPFSGRVFDLVYCVNAVHHFDDAQSFIADAATLLRPGGALAIVGIDPRTIHRRYHYDYFEGAKELDLLRYQSFGQLLDWTAAAGLADLRLLTVDTASIRYVGRDIFNEPFLKKASNSLTALLSDEVYAAGLRRIEADVAAAEAAGTSIEFRSDVPFCMISGRYLPGDAPASLPQE